jgi:type IV secretory pathway protease TraF
MSKATSPFYPPRARWYSPVVYLSHAITHRLALDRLHLPPGVFLLPLTASLFVPGLGFHFRNKLWGTLAMSGSVLLFCSFIIWLGYPIANAAFGLLISIHVSGITYYCSPWLNGERLVTRIVVALLLTLVLTALLYVPVRKSVQETHFAPLRTPEGVVVIRKLPVATPVARGDTVAYNLQEATASHFYAHGGLTLGKILALPGERINFTATAFTINGVSHPLLPHMPTSGEVIVPENDWFIWPNLAIIGGHGNVAEEAIATMMLRMAQVPQHEFVGKPFIRWFGRRQKL